MCNTVLHPGVTVFQGFIVEFVGTSILIFLVCNCLDPISEKKQDSMAIKFAMVVTLVSYVAVSVSFVDKISLWEWLF
jgi:glycerol uptake facilitator-like aquaporin